jgi:ABC-type multidrug transport system, ATPase component
MKEVIKVTSLYKKYKESESFALKNISFSVHKGEIFGILGTNGAGKTTLMSILMGSIKPTAGSFTICDLSFSKQAHRIRYRIGVVPQEYALYPTLTARENLLYFASLYGLKGKDLHEKVVQALTRVELLEVADKRIKYFSGGMKRRINLIAGILHTPEVLFLDEPTVGVDVMSKNIILQYLKELNGQGMSVLYTSHHMQEAQEFCHRVAILHKGEILCEDTPQGLIAQKKALNLEEVFIHFTSQEPSYV